MVKLGNSGLEWFFIFCLNIMVGFVIFVSVYVLIFFVIFEIKDEFYD